MSEATKEQIEKTVKISKVGAIVRSDSLAKIFDRTHKQVLALIRSNLEFFKENDISPKDYFFEVKTITSKNKEYTRYDLTRKGFDLIALSLKGKNAKLYQIWYIDEFHRKTNVINEHKQIAHENKENPLWLEFRQQGKELRTKLTDAINDFELPQRLREGKSEFNFVSTRIVNYSRLIYKVLEIEMPKGTNPRDTLDIRTLVKLETLEERVAKMIESKINDDVHYKEIYQFVKGELNGNK